MKDLSIIIINYNTKKILRDCLNSLYQYIKDLDFEVIVVDNNSSDQSVEMIRREFTKVKLIKNQANRGFGPANNQGIKIAQGKHLLFLNSDTILFDSSINRLVDFLEQNKQYGVVGPQILNKDRTIQLSACARFPNLFSEFLRNFLVDRVLLNRIFRDKDYFGRYSLSFKQHTKSREVAFVSGACFLVRREVIKKTKGFDERFFLYQEEIDWMKRIYDAGYRIYLLAEAKIIHLGGVSTKKSMRDNKKFNYQIENRYKYFSKHYGFLYLFLVRLVDILGAIFSILILGTAWLVTKLFGIPNQKILFALYFSYQYLRYNLSLIKQ